MQSIQAFHPISDTLPIYRMNRPGDVLFYTPGYAVVSSPHDAIGLEEELKTIQTTNHPVLSNIRNTAVEVIRTWEKFSTPVFAPVCLTLYLSLACNLRCRYCFSSNDHDPPTNLKVDIRSIEQGADMVAKNCRLMGRPFTLVIHGGGEPTLDNRLEEILDLIDSITEREGLRSFRYIATNGIMTTEKARLLARRFDLIGISCDGPEQIDLQQRPSKSGDKDTHRQLIQTADILHAEGKGYNLRVTITPNTVGRQEEIASYLCAYFHSQEIHVEPVYPGGRASQENCISIDRAEEFATSFFRAQQIANSFGVKWTISGVRPESIHPGYCQIFRDVLHLIPGDAVSACFKISFTGQKDVSDLLIGRMDAEGKLQIDEERINKLRHEILSPPDVCRGCFNKFHCTRGCPDHCYLKGEAFREDFRCRVNKLIAAKRITNAVDEKLREKPLTLSGRDITGFSMMECAE